MDWMQKKSYDWILLSIGTPIIVRILNYIIEKNTFAFWPCIHNKLYSFTWVYTCILKLKKCQNFTFISTTRNRFVFLKQPLTWSPTPVIWNLKIETETFTNSPLQKIEERLPYALIFLFSRSQQVQLCLRPV